MTRRKSSLQKTLPSEEYPVTPEQSVPISDPLISFSNETGEGDENNVARTRKGSNADPYHNTGVATALIQDCSRRQAWESCAARRATTRGHARTLQICCTVVYCRHKCSMMPQSLVQLYTAIKLQWYTLGRSVVGYCSQECGSIVQAEE